MEKKLTKSNNTMIAGVCAGVAEYFGWDVTIVRIVWALCSIGGLGLGVLLYIICLIVMPKK